MDVSCPRSLQLANPREVEDSPHMTHRFSLKSTQDGTSRSVSAISKLINLYNMCFLPTFLTSPVSFYIHLLGLVMSTLSTCPPCPRHDCLLPRILWPIVVCISPTPMVGLIVPENRCATSCLWSFPIHTSFSLSRLRHHSMFVILVLLCQEMLL